MLIRRSRATLEYHIRRTAGEITDGAGAPYLARRIHAETIDLPVSRQDLRAGLAALRRARRRARRRTAAAHTALRLAAKRLGMEAD